MTRSLVTVTTGEAALALQKVREHYTDDYLQRLEENLGIGESELVDIVTVADRYGTNLPWIATWMRSGLTLQQVFVLLETRDAVETVANQRVSIPAIQRFRNHFRDVPEGPVHFAAVIEEIQDTTACKLEYLSTIMDMMVQIGVHRQIYTYRPVLRDLDSLWQ